ncbi:MAG: ATPase, T2SS/T4P/T4SS family, partial [Planctomycetia bacterium]
MRAVARGCAVAVCACWAVAAKADDVGPSPSPEWLSRDAVGGVAVLPLVCWWAWVAAWSATCDWVFRDANRFKVRPEFWTALVVFPFAAAAVLAWWIPWSAVGQALMAVAWMLPLYLYGRERNPTAPQAESIFTRVHIRRAARAILGRLGVTFKAAEGVDNGLPWVKLVATSAQTPEENQKWQAEALAMPGFDQATKLLQLAAAARATTVVVEMAADGFRVAHEVDAIPGPARGVTVSAKGVGKSKQTETWGDAPPLDAKVGTAAVEALKIIAGSAAAALGGERDAGFTIEVDGKKRACRLAERVTKTAKQVDITLEVPPFAPKKLEELGMSAAVANRVRELVALEKGLFVVSSPPASGCTTTFDTVLSSTDRLVRDFVSIEDSGSPAKEVQYVTPVRYAAAAGEKPVQALKAAMLEDPRAVVTRDLTDGELAGRLMELADDQQIVLLSMRAADALDAIQR